MTRLARTFLCKATLLIAVVSAATLQAQTRPMSYSWTEIVVPGNTVVSAFGINDRGQVAIDNAVGPSGIYRHGAFTPLPPPPPGVQQVNATGINNDGVIVGTALASTFFDQGFILVNGTYTFFSRAGWDDTDARAIGNSGLVTGRTDRVNGDGAGFVYDPATGIFTDVTPPGSKQTFAQGINAFGRVAGSGHDSGSGVTGEYGFVLQPVSSPGNQATAPFLQRFAIADSFTAARGINDSGITVGFTFSGQHFVGFVGNAALGYQLLLPPGADSALSSTVCEGINNLAQVVCTLIDDLGNTHAFIGSPRGNSTQN